MLSQLTLIKLLVLLCLFKTISNTVIRRRQTKPIPVCVGGFTVKPDGVTICNKDASGALRNSNEIDCQFPFNYKGVWYDTCTKMDQNGYWCSVDSIFQNRMAMCEKECPLLARKLVQNYPGSTHTSCVPADSNAKILSPTPAEIQQILDLHNFMRSSVSPTSSDLKALSWDFGLSRVAQSKANSCGVFGHDCQGCRNLLNNSTILIGQNAYANTGGAYDASFWYNVLSAFYTEIANFKYGTGSLTSNWENVGHYTQIVSSSTLKVGCGASKCGNNLYAYCNYANIQESITTPYTSGSPCSQCNANQCSNNLCSCNKVCQNYGTLDPISCKCNCQPYSTGELCEILVCDKTDAEYGCWGPGNIAYCGYSNTVAACPFTCGICQI